MKKKLVSLVLVTSLVLAMCAPAFATKGFNQSVFDGREDITVQSDDMEGKVTVVPASDNGQFVIPVLSSEAVITVRPIIILNDTYDYYLLVFDYLGTNWASLDGIVIKIGDNRYSFSNCYTSHSVNEGYASEHISFYMKKQVYKMIDDLKDHRDDEVKVRLTGSSKNIDFTLPDDAKNAILDLYDLYVAGGGTREANMYSITEFDPVIVKKNGWELPGNILSIIMGALPRK